jgi:ABC-type polysaccharide/polyol phosphate transport system ATPase subunit
VKNGAGKSTLLSLILGTIYPTKGNIIIFQKIIPLLEPGQVFILISVVKEYLRYSG